MKINTDKNCNIVIYDDTEYPINGLTYSNSVSLYIVAVNESNNQRIIYNKLVQHNNSSPIILAGQDQGFMTIYHFILPKDPNSEHVPSTSEYVRVSNYITDEFINNLVSLQFLPDQSFIPEGIIIDPDNIGTYYSNGREIYYKGTDESIRKVDIQELIEINARAYNLIKYTYNFFSVCSLRKCYIALCQKIFQDRAFDRCFNEKIDSQLIYKRDLVWAALNVIQYMIDSNQLAEAQRLLERINGCNGLCSGVDTGDKGCGCE